MLVSVRLIDCSSEDCLPFNGEFDESLHITSTCASATSHLSMTMTQITPVMKQTNKVSF